MFIRSILIAISFGLTSCSYFEPLRLGQANAIWSESIFFRGHSPSTGVSLAQSDIQFYADQLTNNSIKYGYIFAGPYGKDGHLPEYAFSETAIASVKFFMTNYPELVILPWIGGIQGKTVYLNDSTWVSNALSDTERLITTLGVAGVHIDFEYILKGNAYLDTTIVNEVPGISESYANYVNSFHQKLRSLVPHAFISSVVTATSSGTRPWKRKTTIKELTTLTKYVDQISFLFYDTHIRSQDAFGDNCKQLLRDIQYLKGHETAHHAQYLVAIGTFVNVPELQEFRDLEIENIQNTLKTIVQSQQELSKSLEIVDGIAIYCNWQTSSEEWAEFHDYWGKY